MDMKIPDKAQDIINIIKASGAQGYLVGGAVRDLLMNKAPQDLDVATSLEPNALALLFAQGVSIGGVYGTISVDGVEITPFRTESAYQDLRHPDKVSFGVDILADLARRDFTINALAYDGDELLDPYDGQGDINARLLRCVGEPRERFGEDALRILRLYRFAGITGFTIDANTAIAACERAADISILPRERVRAEMQKILTSPYPSVIEPLIQSGALEYYGLSCTTNALRALDKVPCYMLERWWGLCKLCKADAHTVCTAFDFAQKLERDISALNALSIADIPPTAEAVKTVLSAMPSMDFALALEAISAIDESFVQIHKIYCEICQKGEVFRLESLAINGNDLAEIGVKSKKIGDILRELLMYVIKNPAGNNRVALLKLANYLKYLLKV